MRKRLIAKLAVVVSGVVRGKSVGIVGSYSRNLLGLSAEEVGISLVRSSAAVPENEPLVGLAGLELVLEAEVVVRVVVADEVEQDG